MSPGVIALLSALGGVAIGAIVNVITTLVTKKYDYKRLIVESGIEQWKECIRASQAAGGKGTDVASVASFILQNSVILRLVGRHKLTDKEVSAVLVRSKGIQKVFVEHHSPKSK
jgi:fructose-1-phosphate kinase PfkB-like protein